MTRWLGFFLLFLCSLIVSGQKPLLTTSEIDNQFSKVWKTSEASRKQYAWKSRTEVIRNDKVIQVLVEELSYGTDGRQLRKIISNDETPLPSGIIIRRIAEEQKAKTIAFMNGLRQFLEKYALTDDDKRHAFFSTATIGAPDANGQLLVTGTDVFTRGDLLKWWIDTKYYTITRANISTVYKENKAEFTATYYLLPGLNYMSSATIRIPSQGIVVNLKFYDYTPKK